MNSIEIIQWRYTSIRCSFRRHFGTRKSTETAISTARFRWLGLRLRTNNEAWLSIAQLVRNDLTQAVPYLRTRQNIFQHPKITRGCGRNSTQNRSKKIIANSSTKKLGLNDLTKVIRLNSEYVHEIEPYERE